MNKVKILLSLLVLFSISVAVETTIDDFQGGYQLAITRDTWYAFADNGATVTNPKAKYGGYKAVSVGHAGLASLNLVNPGDPWVGAGIGLLLDGNGGKRYDLANCTGGFSYEYKGEAHNFNVEWISSGPKRYVGYFTPVRLEKKANWTLAEVSLDKLEWANWTDNEALDLSKADRIVWTVPTKDTTIINGNFQIKDFKCLGNLNIPATNSIEWADVSTLFGQEQYTGSAVKAKIVAKFLNRDGTTKTLQEGRDYDVVYANNTNKGTATATVTGKNSYTGTKVLKFEIKDLPKGGLLWAVGDDSLRLRNFDFIESGYLFGYNYRDARIYTQHGALPGNLLGNWGVGADNAITPNGLQVLMTAKNGLYDNPSAPLVAFNWKDDTNTDREVNIREFGGLCITYNLEGAPVRIRLEMDQDVRFPWDKGYDRYAYVLPAGNHSIKIPWSAFSKSWGITELKDAVEYSTGISFELQNFSTELKQSMFTLREFGAYNSCSGVTPAKPAYAGQLKNGLLPKGGLMWDFATAKKADNNSKMRTPDDDGGYWYAAGWANSSVYQASGVAFQNNNGINGGLKLKWDDVAQEYYPDGVPGGALDNEYGLQVRMKTEKGGPWEGSDGAHISFNWKDNHAEENISAFDGLCLVYNLTGEDLKVRLRWDGNTKYPFTTHGMYEAHIPAGNHSVNIPWSAFKHSWGLGSFNAAIEDAVAIDIALYSSQMKEKEALFTLREFGSYGSCSKAKPAPAKYTGDGLVPPPKPQDVLWNFASGVQDVRIKDAQGDKTNESGYFWGYNWGPSGTNSNEYGWFSNRNDANPDNMSIDFHNNFTEKGLQVGLRAKVGGGAGFGFVWNNPTQTGPGTWEYTILENIRDFDGVCLVYAMEGNVPNFEMELTVNENHFLGSDGQPDWSTFLTKVPSTNGKKALINIPWSNYNKFFGTVTKYATLNQSRGFSFRIANNYHDSYEDANAQITLLQIGKLGACRLPDEGESVNFLSPKGPAVPFLIKPFIADSYEEPKLIAGSAKLTIFNLKGNVVMQKTLAAGETISASMQSLNKGVYIAQVKNGSQVQTFKVSK